ALAHWDVTIERPPVEAVRALQTQRRLFASERQRQEVAAGCYEVLLAWAQAEALPGPNAGQQRAALQALRLLQLAQALARANTPTPPQTFPLRRARSLARSGGARGAAAERARAGAVPRRTALDHFLAALQEYRQGQSERALGTCEEVLRQQAD